MNWINIYGLAFMLFIMIPNIIFAVKNKGGFQNLWNNEPQSANYSIAHTGFCACRRNPGASAGGSISVERKNGKEII